MRILLIGHGNMGRILEELISAQGHSLLGVISSRDRGSLASIKRADVAIDFSHPDMLPEVISYIRRTGTPLCCGTTGYTPAQMNDLRGLSASAPLLYSANFSLGVAVFRRVLSQISPLLMEDFDIEMVETHHNQKIDAPSGTANLLADAIDPAGQLERIYGRSGPCGKRPKNELGIFSLRGGTVSGTHTVSFFGEDETFSITHSASSRRIFAIGALKAALALADRNAGAERQTAGWYELEDILFPSDE